MPEYIDRDRAISEASYEFGNVGAKVMSRIPIADVAPVRHGRWVKTYEDCDLCHECYLCGKSALLDGNEREVLSPWCPNRGAKMDLEDPQV